MTVCVATLCQFGILGASDRMLTSGDVEFEPETAKIYPLTSSIAAMVAGDSALQSEIYLALSKIIGGRVESDPNTWLLVKDIAYLYRDVRQAIRRKRAEQALLSPLGLDCDGFVSRQSAMAKDFVTRITEEIVNFSLPSTETIIAGVDGDGSHIYTLINDDIRCDNSVGFSAIGSGYWHANSQLMHARYNFVASLPDSLLLTYIAKRRAEIAPGVGKGTDMFMVGPQLGSYTRINDVVLGQLDRTYETILKKECRGLESGKKEIQKYVARLTEASAQAAAAKEQAAPSPPIQEQESPTTDGEKGASD